MPEAMLLALALDVLFGGRAGASDPEHRIARVFDRLTGAHRAQDARILGSVLATFLLALAIAVLLPEGWPGQLLAGLLAWPLIGARRLDDHLAGMAAAHASDDTKPANAALTQLAEGACRRVVAPLFWGALLGLAGSAAYVVLSALTGPDAKSAEGVPRARAILGLADWIPTRLTGLLFVLGARARGTAFRTIRRDAGGIARGRAPWPEAALAGALGLRLAHPQRAGEPAYLNPVGGDPRHEDLAPGLRLYRRALLFLSMALALWAVVAS